VDDPQRCSPVHASDASPSLSGATLTSEGADGALGILTVTIRSEHQLAIGYLLTGLGILQVRKCAARMGRSPATGEAIKIKASKKIANPPVKELKEAV
jgi:DNA-binding protein HU-beta